MLWEATFMAITKRRIPKEVLPRSGLRQMLEFVMPFQNAPRYCKLRNNPNFNAKHKQLCNKIILPPKCKTITCANYPAGNSKQFCKSVKLLNCKRASTIPVINHDGKRIACDGQEAKANTLNHFFQL